MTSNPDAVSKILRYHAVVGARIMPSFTGRNETLPTLLEGQTLEVDKVRRGRPVGRVLPGSQAALVPVRGGAGGAHGHASNALDHLSPHFPRSSARAQRAPSAR